MNLKPRYSLPIQDVIKREHSARFSRQAAAEAPSDHRCLFCGTDVTPHWNGGDWDIENKVWVPLDGAELIWATVCPTCSDQVPKATFDQIRAVVPELDAICDLARDLNGHIDYEKDLNRYWFVIFRPSIDRIMGRYPHLFNYLSQCTIHGAIYSELTASITV